MIVALVTFIAVDIFFMFNLVTVFNELLTTLTKTGKSFCAFSCYVFTHVAIIAKYLSTLITAMSSGEGGFTLLWSWKAKGRSSHEVLLTIQSS